MEIYLVQHGRAFSKEQDPGQGLSEEGRQETGDMARLAREKGIRPARIEHSSKLRARQTAEIFAAALEPRQGLAERAGLKPMDDVQALAAGLESASDLMLVGHLPFLEKLTSWLTAGRVEPPVMKFQNSGIVCLEHSAETGSWHIKWTLMPRVD